MEASIAIQVLPQVADTKKMLSIVDKVIEHIQKSGFHYVVSPFETTIEGPFEDLMKLLKECQEIAVSEGADSLATYVKIFYSPLQGVLTIDEKLEKYHG